MKTSLTKSKSSHKKNQFLQKVELFTKLTKGKVEQSGSRFTALFFWETGFIFDNIYQFLVHSQFMVRILPSCYSSRLLLQSPCEREKLLLQITLCSIPSTPHRSADKSLRRCKLYTR